VKIVNNYIIRSLLEPLFFCLFGFLMVIIIFDLSQNLGDFIDASTPFVQILRYYLYFIPASIVVIAPIGLLLAVLASLYRLTQNNELTAMRASGISLYRLIAPILVVGFIFSILVTIISETVGPKAAYWAHVFIDQQKNPEVTLDPMVRKAFSYRNTAESRTWYMEEFDSNTSQMKGVQLTQERESGINLYKIYADKAEWLDGQWWLIGQVVTKRFNEQGYPYGLPENQAKKALVNEYKVTETPELFINLIRDPTFLSGTELSRYLKSNTQISPKNRAILETDVQYKFAIPWACLISALIGVPMGFTTARQGVKKGMIFCICLFFSYYIVLQIFLALGKNSIIHPIPAVWVSNLLYLIIGAVLIIRMR
jgi:LPS export ABC transporter permease LptG